MSLIDDYISGFPEPVQVILQQIRQIIQEEAPEATEAFTYKMPTFKLKKNLVHFAAYKKHIGFYPTPSGISNFQNELSDFETSKGAIKFPLDKEIPFELIRKIVRFRVQEMKK